ncbi:filamentous hemagglutinin N-terminal domain-containing protein [Laspinema olomoucense]|uniref:two-partner secretion domain-containing protein n=1 Tax=Laspinema olomoucense TaxID=3231600 RepID=UPI0021BB88DE|nr:filamentous hemagglutinin N-terminal domain-containing protein [Laspinema sp. D3c]MCT7996110.1 filamentous hemagglutinin N-terminal domain-containing protein [Laspinema sp. D3c]
MKSNAFSGCWLLSGFSLAIVAIATPAFPQIVPDTTLPENSTVNSDGNSFQINGGTIRGGNLFHSFQEFSIPTNGSAFFNNSPAIQNIFSRITGNSLSNIDGILSANGLANLFLINSNGIIFGPNAQLQIGGSFLATTANRIGFADGSLFSTEVATTQPILTISIPTKLQFDSNTGRIINQSQATPEQFPFNSIGAPLGLAVAPGQTLGFVGGEVTLNNGNIAALEGQIELGGVVNGTVNLSPTETGFSLSYLGVEQFGNIQLFNTSVVDASSLPPMFPNARGGGGAIQVRGDRLIVENSGITSSTYGLAPGQDITVTAREIEMGGFLEVPIPPNIQPSEELPPIFAAGFFSQTEGVGNAGNLRVEAERITLRNGAQLSTSTFAEGNGGELTIEARDIEISGISPAGPSAIVTVVQQIPESPILAIGNAGNISIESDRLTVRDGGTISASTSASGNAGNVTIENTGLVEMSGGATNPLGDFAPSRIAAFVDPSATGEAGNITINTGRLTVSDRAEINAVTRASVPGGNVTVNTRNLTVQQGAQIAVSTQASGRGGRLTVNASETLELIGTDETGFSSGLFSQSQPSIQFVPDSPEPIFDFNTGGDAGDIVVSANRLLIRDGAAISADTFTNGQGGSVSINADSIQVTGRSKIPPFRLLPSQDPDGLLPSRITVITTGTGNAGSLSIATEQLNIEEQAKVAVDASFGGGSAGNLQVSSSELRLDTGRLTAETASGEGGNVRVEADNIFLRRQSEISTTAGNANLPGNGGNININTDIIAALENSDISANAFDGSGGVINITAEGIFGLEARSREELESLLDADLTQFDPNINLPDTSDITAISRTEPTLSGQIALNTPDIDPSRGTVDLEDDIVDVASLIDRDPCRIVQNSEFVQTGKGGIPPSPTDTLTPTGAWEDWRVLQLDESPVTETIPNTPSPAQTRRIPKIEATGMRLNDRGELELIAPESATPVTNPSSLSPGCLSAQQPKTLPDSSITTVPETLTIARFELRDSSAISAEQLATITEPYANRTLTFAELQEVAAAIANFYQQQGYIGSGAFLPPQIVRDRIVTIQAIENRLEDIRVTGNSPLNNQYATYVRNRLGLNPGDIVNADTLLESLYLLQFDPRLEKISAELAAGVEPDTSFLAVRVEDARFFSPQLAIDNGRSPSVGSLRRQAQLTQYNLLGLGDIATFNYANTDGSNSLELGYAVPLTANNGTLSFRYSTGDSNIVEPPFDEVDIEANSRTYELTYREPIIQRIISQSPNQSLQNASDLIRTELALGITASRRESETSLLGVNFPLSPGANDDGETRVSAIRFFQDALWQDSQQILAARSEFSLGVGLFDATINDNEPDSRFLAWRGQGQWVRRVAGLGGKRQDPLLILRGDLQLATTSLLPLEQFSVGGFNSVRGYRQDALLVDNGAFASLEFQYPLVEFPKWQGSLQVIPFLDLGVGWNWDEGDRANPDKNTLLSTGLGLQLQLGNDFSARLDWGIPLVEIDSRDRTWQENGLYFSVRWNPF